MATWTLNFQTAGIFDALRRRRSARTACAKPMFAAVSPAPARVTASREVSQRRAEAMRGLFPKLSSWMARHGHLSEMSEVDRYLSQSTDIFDLERRIRDIERRGSTTRWFQ